METKTNDIAAVMPTESATTTAIYDWYKKTGDAEPARQYLGMSVVGHLCQRYLWYYFRHCVTENCTGRTYRIFDTGDKEEARVIENLREIGYTVHDRDGNGKQFGFTALAGHLAGHMDACVLGVKEAPKTWHVFEGKALNEKSYKDLQNKGLKESKPVYYAQTQMYMKYSGMTRTLFIAVNKNTDEIYCERVRYDAQYAQELEDKARAVIESKNVMPKCAGSENSPDCKWCSAWGLCWGENGTAVKITKLSCRQCVHATPEMDSDTGRWSCYRKKCSLSFNDQCKICREHLFVPSLIDFADPQDSGFNPDGSGWIEYKNRHDGAIWKQGPCAGQYSSEELIRLPGPMVAADAVDLIKNELNGTIVKVSPALPDQWEDAELLWSGDHTLLVTMWQKLFKEDLTKLKPVRTFEDDNCNAAEFSRNRLAIHPKDRKEPARILRGKE